jgi:hypothetical protein
MDLINLRRDKFHGEWNYEILPRKVKWLFLNSALVHRVRRKQASRQPQEICASSVDDDPDAYRHATEAHDLGADFNRKRLLCHG